MLWWNIQCLSLHYYYFHSKCSHKLHSLVLIVPATSTLSNCPHFLPVSNIRISQSDSFSPRTLILWHKLPHECFFLISTIILTTSSQESFTIYSPCPYNLHFLPHSFPFISHMLFIMTTLTGKLYIDWLLNQPCIGWNLV